MKAVLAKLFERQNLTREEARAAMDQLMNGNVPPEQIGAFLGALRGKGETIKEIAGLADSMRAHAIRLNIQRSDLIDTCGTGGSGLHTFNISTIVSLILAAAGAGTVKHGNRSISSKCGSADVLEALGVAIDLPPDRVSACVDQLGFGFLFARSLHPSMKHVAAIRVSLGVRTVFNLLGPLTNPAFAQRQLMGVFDGALISQLAYVLKELGSHEVMVVHGNDGLDEITLTGSTAVAHLRNGKVETYQLTPADFGMKPCRLDELIGGDVATNVAIVMNILEGRDHSAKRGIVIANAAAALVIAQKAPTITEGCLLAANMIDSGKAMDLLIKLKAFR